MNWANKTLPFTSGTHKGSVGNLKIAASDCDVPPKFHEEPERLAAKPTSPTVVGGEL